MYTSTSNSYFAAQKYWITNGALHAKHIVVFAQLFVDGVNQGIHGVLVRCRGDNLEPVQGVLVEDMGHKVIDDMTFFNEFSRFNCMKT